MSIPKIKGIETEWGVGIRSKDGFKPAEADHFRRMINVIRKYLMLPTDSEEAFVKEIENRNRFGDHNSDGEFCFTRRSRLYSESHSYRHYNLLPNGGRFYIDAPHLEYSTPECLSAKTLVAADKAGEAIVGLARIILSEELAERGEEAVVYKDNTDRRGNTYGCHENYLVSREAFERIINPASLELGYLASFLICRLIFSGSGKMGIEEEKGRLNESIFQISQRADFIKHILSDSTTSKRALVNNRDEPLADRKRFARLHIIMGDANLAEVAAYMKVGITSIILKMIEDDFLQGDIIVADPVQGIKLVSQDLTCKKPVLETLGGRKLSSLDLLEEYSEKIQAYLSRIGEPLPEDLDLAPKLAETVSDFRIGNKARLRRRFDWQIKLGLFEDFLEEHGFSWKDIERATFKGGGPAIKVSTLLHKRDILYHDINRDEGLYWACKEDGDTEEMVDGSDIVNLVKNPPPECRSYFRGRCIAKFFADIDTIDWDSITFSNKGTDTGRFFSVFHRSDVINLNNPVWGGRSDAEEIINKANSFKDLIAELEKIKEVENA